MAYQQSCFFTGEQGFGFHIMKTFHVFNSIAHVASLAKVTIIQFDFEVKGSMIVRSLKAAHIDQKNGGGLDASMNAIYTFEKLSGSALLTQLQSASFAVGSFDEMKVVKRTRGLNSDQAEIEILRDIELQAGSYRMKVEAFASFASDDNSYASVTMLYE